MRRRTLLACVGSLVMLVALALGPVQPARAGDLVVTAAVWLHPDHTGGRPQTVFPTADAHGDVSSTGNSMVDVNNANRQSTQTGEWPPGGEPTLAVASAGFSTWHMIWHTAETIAGWVMRLFWIMSVVVGLFDRRRRSRDRPAQ
jgi:hypothetical protein